MIAAPGDAVDEQVAAAVGAYVPQRHRGEGLLLALDDDDRSQSSSANRVIRVLSGRGAELGRHGATKPAGRTHGRNDMAAG